MIPSQLWSTTRDSAVLPIQPIFRVRSPDPFVTIFAIFSLKSPPNTMVTRSQQWPTTHDSAVLPIRPIFRVRSPDPFLTIFTIFSLKSPPNMMVTPSQQWQITHDSAVLKCPTLGLDFPSRPNKASHFYGRGFTRSTLLDHSSA